jgi:hypothetical protein
MSRAGSTVKAKTHFSLRLTKYELVINLKTAKALGSRSASDGSGARRRGD